MEPLLKELIKKMSLEEKAQLMSGADFWHTVQIDRLGIPSIMLTDGPHGIRKQGGKTNNLGLGESIKATCFPTAATLANSWDKHLLKSVGESLGKEAASLDVSVLLGPALNIKRNPLCGRNFEYFSEDPYLTGKMASSMIQGIQSIGVAACPKHFAVNSQEELRMTIDEIVDERSLREMYLEGFRYAVTEGKAKTIMTSYNRVNGTYSSENRHLLKDILVDEWNFSGVVMTDWGAENDRVEALIAGNQLEMPSSNGFTSQEIVDAVHNKTLDETILNQRVGELLSLVFESQASLGKGKHFTDEEHHLLAVDAATRSMVLLKNEDQILPLRKETKVAVIGSFAKLPRYQGAGSSLIDPTTLDNALDELKKTNLDIIGYAEGFKRFGGKSKSLAKKAVALAKKAEVVLFFMGLDESSESEGIDRTHMFIQDNQIELLKSISQENENIVVVLSGGSPVEMGWDTYTKAVVHSYLSGQGSGKAVTQIMTGVVNPSGKLAESYPHHYQDVSSSNIYPGKEATSEHREGLYFGYRYYDALEMDVKYPFGFGLSYTTFSYSNLTVSESKVSCEITNNGSVRGEEVVQVYISLPKHQIFRPKQELKGFEKIHLNPGETKKIDIFLDEHAFSYFNIIKNSWLIEPGIYEISVGSSSRDLRLTASLELDSPIHESPYSIDLLPHYYSGDVKNVTDEEFTHLLGRVPPSKYWDKTKELGFNDTIGQGAYGKGLGRFMYKTVRFMYRFLLFFRKPNLANFTMYFMHLPYRNLHRMSGGKIDRAMLDGILTMVNGHFWKGYKEYRVARKAKRKRTKK